MRISPLKSELLAAGASFQERVGVEICSAFSDTEKEYRFIREAVGVTDFSYIQKYRIPEEKAIDFLDGLVAGNVARVRFGRILHTFISDDNGMLISDCYIANNDQEYLLLCESIIDDASMAKLLASRNAAEAGLEDLTDNHAAISIDGYKAWAVAKELFGADVLGLPYLSIEMYPFENEKIRLVRAGKTSEFGYLLIAPLKCAAQLYKTVSELAVKHGGGCTGVSIHNDLRLEGRFFNIFREGEKVKDPLILGLQWMIDFDKGGYSGSDAIAARRENGTTHKIIGVKTAGAPEAFKPGAGLYDEEKQTGTLVTVCFSHTLASSVGLAVFPKETAWSGLSFRLGSPAGCEVCTISMPPIMPKSLTVKLDEM
jgi:aminomethyltransferase